MTKHEAVKEAMKYGKKVYIDESASFVDGVEVFHFFSMHIDDRFVSAGKDSWESCLKEIAGMDPEKVRQEKIKELRENLKKLESEGP